MAYYSFKLAPSRQGFHCPVTGLVLSLAEPTGSLDVEIPVSRIIQTAIASGGVINIDGTYPTANKVRTNNIVTAAVTAAKIADEAVTAAKIATDAVTADKILDATITGGKIVDGTITPGKLSFSAASPIQTLNFSYEVPIEGTSVGSVPLVGELPAECVLVGGYLEITEAFTAEAGAEIEIVTSEGLLVVPLVLATEQYWTEPLIVKPLQGVMLGGPYFKTVDISTLIMNVTVGALIDGAFKATLLYVLAEEV